MHEYEDIYYTYWFKDLDDYGFSYTKPNSGPKTEEPARSRFDDGNVINMTQDATGAYTPDGINGR